VAAKKTTKTMKPEVKITAMDVYKWVSRPAQRGRFTSADVADHFNIAPTRAAAFIAILRIKNLVDPGDRLQGDPDESSHWQLATATASATS